MNYKYSKYFRNNKRSTEASIDKKSVKDLQNKVINIDEESRNKKHYTYSKENINKKFESKDQKFPDLKMHPKTPYKQHKLKIYN